MNEINKYSFQECDRAEALKEIGDYISDNHKDIEAVNTRRIRSFTSIGTITSIGLALAIQGTDTSSNIIRALAVLAAATLICVADSAIATDKAEQKRKIRVAKAMRTHIQNQVGVKVVKIPTDLEAFLQDAVKDTHRPHGFFVDKTNAVVKGTVAVVGSLSIVFASAQEGLDKKIISYVQSYMYSANENTSRGQQLRRTN